MVAVIDAAQDVTHRLPALKAAGVRSIIRYDCALPKGRWKEASAEEVRAIGAAGFAVGIVNEAVGNVAGAFSESTGYRDALYSRNRALARSQPAGSAIYYAVDFDASSADVENHVIPYFRGVTKAMTETHQDLPVLKVGAYCNGLCAGMLRDRKLVDYVWITCSGGFRGSRGYVHANLEDLWQYACERELCGLDVDYNLSPTGRWGQFIPGQKAVPKAALATADWPKKWGPQVGKASWYHDGANADETPVDNHADLSAASRFIPFGGRVRVTRLDRHELSSVVVTVHDRGPYSPGRIIDLRPAAAKALDMIEAGIVPVRLEVEI
jgi:hypothetical protein